MLILQQVSFSYELLRRFKEMAAVLDRAVELVPADLRTKLQRTFVDLEWHADPHPAHSVMQAILAEDHETVASVADRWTYLALYERDAAAGMRAVALIPSEGISELGVNFPAPWFEGLFARLRGDQASARRAWTRAHSEVDKAVQSQPAYAEQLSVLGMIDAALGNKEAAIREGKRAVELLPMTADALKNGLLVEHLAIIYAWTGEKDLAFEQLAYAAQIPSEINYGHLQLHPLWDPLRGDPRFDKFVASLAPQPQSP